MKLPSVFLKASSEHCCYVESQRNCQHAVIDINEQIVYDESIKGIEIMQMANAK